MRSQQSKDQQSKRWRTNIPVELGAGEVPVREFAIGSFSFVLSDRSLFFWHAATAMLDGPHPAIWQVSLPQGVV